MKCQIDFIILANTEALFLNTKYKGTMNKWIATHAISTKNRLRLLMKVLPDSSSISFRYSLGWLKSNMPINSLETQS